jgi:hypothetical protein
MGQTGVGTSSSVGTLLPPSALLTVVNPGTTTVYVGNGTQVTSSNGFPVLAGVAPTTLASYPGGQPGTIRACTASGTVSAFGWCVSSASGGTGP